MTEAKIIFHHDDEIDPDCMRDYLCVTVEIDDVEVAEFGDSYHDKGYEKAKGFIRGWWEARGNLERPIVETESVSDGRWPM